MTLERLEEIEQMQKAAVDQDNALLYTELVDDALPDIIADNKRLRTELNSIARKAKEALDE